LTSYFPARGTEYLHMKHIHVAAPYATNCGRIGCNNRTNLVLRKQSVLLCHQVMTPTGKYIYRPADTLLESIATHNNAKQQMQKSTEARCRYIRANIVPILAIFD
jgi:hypothetical protein